MKLQKSMYHVGLSFGRTIIQVVKLDGKGPLFRVWSEYEIDRRNNELLASYHELQLAHFGFGLVRLYA